MKSESVTVVSVTVAKMTGSISPMLIPVEVPRPIKIIPTVKVEPITQEIPEISTSMKIISGLNSEFKTYMDYRLIINRGSIQWKMQQSAVTNEYGIRTYNGLYMIAVGTGYAKSCGVQLKITLSSGIIINAITGDIKSDRHTDSATHTYAPSNKTMLEFIVDTNKISSKCRTMGDMSWADMQGYVVGIEKI